MNDAATEVDQPQGRPRGFQRFMKLRRWHAIAIAAVAFCLFLLSGGLLNFPSSAVTKAKKVTSLNVATSLETAINSFFTEYGALPYVANQVETDTSEGLKMLIVIMGMETGANPQNTRGVRFLSPPQGKAKQGGLIYDSSGKSVAGLNDSWGNPYVVVLDTDFDERLQFQWGDQSVDLKERRAAVFSAGPDRKLGTSDDIRTW
jgi:hypothetical protein